MDPKIFTLSIFWCGAAIMLPHYGMVLQWNGQYRDRGYLREIRIMVMNHSAPQPAPPIYGYLPMYFALADKPNFRDVSMLPHTLPQVDPSMGKRFLICDLADTTAEDPLHETFPNLLPSFPGGKLLETVNYGSRQFSIRQFSILASSPEGR